MKIVSYGTASVKIESKDQILLFDPYLKDDGASREAIKRHRRRKAVFQKAEHVFITHGHFDHLGSVMSLYKQRDARVYCTERSARTLIRRGFSSERICVVRPGGEITVGEMTVKAYRTRHCKFDAGKLKEVVCRHHIFRHFRKLLHLLWLVFAYPSGRECLLYEIFAEGRRILLLGSAGLDKNEDYPAGADILILPYQGRSDIAEYCVDIVEWLKPQRVLLDHYDDAFPPVSCLEDTGVFLKKMEELHPETFCCVLREFGTFVL